MAFYADDGEVRVTRPLAVVEAVEDSRVSVGIPEAGRPCDVHAAFRRGRIGKDAEVRGARDGKPWVSLPVAVDSKTDGGPATGV